MRVLFSIKPEYAEKILNGTKLFEYRKAIPRHQSVRTVVIYATMPVGKVVGEFEIGGILRLKPGTMWKRTSVGSGITRAFFDTYFDGCDEALAIEVIKPKRYATLKTVHAVSGSSTPPQSFQYLIDDPRELKPVRANTQAPMHWTHTK